MKLLSIHLHPFAGVDDRRHQFTDGSQAILAENEYGKSTIYLALRHALFTPTNLTPAKLRDNFGKLFPRGAGGTTDHCSVTLEFDCGGRKYTLRKTWSSARNGSTSRLDGDGISLVDPLGVQSKLDELIVHGESTYTKVLLLEQDALIKTRDALGESPEIINGSITTVVARVEGEWDLHKLRESAEAEFDSISGRWDMVNRCPQRDRGRFRNIDDPWLNGVGTVLKCYYAHGRAGRELADRVMHEVAYDRLRDKIAAHIRSIASHERARDECAALVETLRLRDEITRLQRERQRLEEARVGWPDQEKALASLTADLDRNRRDRAALAVEQAHATRRGELPGIEAARDQANDHIRSHELRAAEFREEFGGWPNDIGRRIEDLTRAIDDDTLTLSEKLLRVSISAPRAAAIGVRLGMAEPTTIALDAGVGQTREARGRVEFEVEGVRIVVESGEVEVSELVGRIERNQASLASALASIGVPDSATARKRLAQRVEAERQLADLAKRLEEGNLVKELERLHEQEATIRALPESRPLETVRAERDRLEQERVDLESGRSAAETRIEWWKREFGIERTDQLLGRYDRCVRELAALEAQVDKLPPAPEGDMDLESARSWLENLADQLKTEIAEKHQAQLDLKEVETGIRSNPATTDELESRFDDTLRAFEEAEARLHGLHRLSTALGAALVAEDRYAGLTTRVREIFGELTGGRYDMVDAERGVPTGVRAGAVEFSFDQLSQGAKGTLAFAIRLALAESYLAQAPGFLVLDDPFVDLDPERLALAMRAVRNFAERTRTQIVLLTCHPAQKQLFDKPLA